MDLFLVFYGYLSLAFGWLYYIVVFLSLGIAAYFHFKERDLYRTAEVYVKSLTYLGLLDLSVAFLYSVFKTVNWLIF